MRRLILSSRQSPGDILMLTAAVRELHRSHPGQFATDVRTPVPELWINNPYLTPLKEDAGVESIEMHYPLIHQSNQRPYHFLHGYTQFLEDRLNVRLPLTEFRGDIHLDDEERKSPPAHLGELPDRFWILIAGGKYDFTAKWWNPSSYQSMVDHFRGRTHFVQCGEARHWHPPLTGVTNLVGKTSIRDFVRLMHFAEGVICSVTFAMHLAAAVPVRSGGPPNRACVVIAGGREPPQWEAYPQHQFLHTIGQLDCCATGGCWKSRCQPIGDGDRKDRHDRCVRPVSVSDELTIPQCLEMIRPEDVIGAVERTLEGWSMVPQREPVALPFRRNGSQPPRPLSRTLLLEFRHGLGDAAQFTSVLKHLRHYHPERTFDVVSLVGKHSAFQGLCRKSLVVDQDTWNVADYDQVLKLSWDECRTADPRWPNTKVARCLLDVFRLTPIRELCYSEIRVSDEALKRAREYLQDLCGEPNGEGRFRAVLLHYEGNTSGSKKNLTHDMARTVCETVIRAGYVPVILDWDRRSPLPDNASIFCPGREHSLWGGTRTGDAEQLAALIQCASLMIGIDSGPLHVAGAVETPTLGVWTRHHPVHFFELGDHVLHLVPPDHATLANGPAALRCFEDSYRFRVYDQLIDDLPAAVDELLPVWEPSTEPVSVVVSGLTAHAFGEAYYQEHKAAGLDYLVCGDWQRDYGRWLVESLRWNKQAILDVGCACGAIVKGLADAGARMSGCDVNEAMIRRGRDAWPDLADSLFICDTANLHHFPNGQFDGIHTAQVAEHWPPELVPRILRELARVTQPEGMLFCCLDTQDLFRRQGRTQDGEDPTHVCIRPLDWWHAQLADAGWEVCDREYDSRLRRHPLSYLKKYDWDWIIARRRAVPSLPTVAALPRSTETVSIVIAARNNGCYLAEAIESALRQEIPCEVIYSDDGSTDNSLAAARQFVERGLQVLEPAGQGGVCQARNRGASIANGQYLVFLDGDDRLPADFVKRHLDAIQPGAPFAYGPAQAFGEGLHAGTLWKVPNWEDYDRWQTNTVNTSALYARWVFEAAGHWRDRVHTMWDWDLAIRASRFGTPVPSTATLEYRQHAQSWSAQIGEKTESLRAQFLPLVRRVNARLSVGAILSGRLPDLFPRWLDSLTQSLSWLDLPERPECVLLLHNPTPELMTFYQSQLRPYTNHFSSVRLRTYKDRYGYHDEPSRRDAVAAFMARASARLARELRGDLVWLVEDDILVPMLAALRLWETVTQGWVPPAAVAGCYRNRHVPDQYVGGWWKPDGPEELRELTHTEPFDVDFTGTGCLMFWKHHSPVNWESHSRGVPAHDWAWCEAVRRQGRRVLLHPDIRCGHARTATDILDG